MPPSIFSPWLVRLIRSAARVVLCAWLLILVFACAPSVTFQQLQPGRVQLGKDPVLALGTVNLTPQIDVIDKPRHGLVQKFISEVDDHVFKPGAIEADLEANMAAAVSRNPFAKYSREGAGYLINLSGTFSAQDTASLTSTQRTGENNRTETVQAVEVKRQYRLDVSYQVVTAQGSVVGKGRRGSADLIIRTGGTREEAAGACGDWVEKSGSMTRDAVDVIVDEILPHYLTVKRPLKKGSAPGLNEGVSHATDGDLEKAGALWAGLITQADTLSVPDRIALYHNLGVYFESRDMLEESAKIFTSCIVSGGDQLCTEGLNRTRGRQRQLEQLKRAGL